MEKYGYCWKLLFLYQNYFLLNTQVIYSPGDGKLRARSFVNTALSCMPDDSRPVFCWTTTLHMSNIETLSCCFPKAPKQENPCKGQHLSHRDKYCFPTHQFKSTVESLVLSHKSNDSPATHTGKMLFCLASQAISNLIMSNRFVVVYPNCHTEGQWADVTSGIPNNSTSLTNVIQVTV